VPGRRENGNFALAEDFNDRVIVIDPRTNNFRHGSPAISTDRTGSISPAHKCSWRHHDRRAMSRCRRRDSHVLLHGYVLYQRRLRRSLTLDNLVGRGGVAQW
jgi:hypothetical protein